MVTPWRGVQGSGQPSRSQRFPPSAGAAGGGGYEHSSQASGSGAPPAVSNALRDPRSALHKSGDWAARTSGGGGGGPAVLLGGGGGQQQQQQQHGATRSSSASRMLPSQSAAAPQYPGMQQVAVGAAQASRRGEGRDGRGPIPSQAVGGHHHQQQQQQHQHQQQQPQQHQQARTATPRSSATQQPQQTPIHPPSRASESTAAEFLLPSPRAGGGGGGGGGGSSGGGGGGGASQTPQASSSSNPHSLSRIGRDINLTKRMLAHATRLALADNDKQAEMEKWNLSQVERAMKEKRVQDQVAVAECQSPEDYIMRERGWWHAQLQGWQDKRDRVRAEMERHALEKLLSSKTAEQVKELEDPQAAQQWLQLMEASLHPFINELNRTVTMEPSALPPSPSRTRRMVPTEGECQASESRAGLWTTVPKTTRQFVEARSESLQRRDWSDTFSRGTLGSQGEPRDRFWDPAALPDTATDTARPNARHASSSLVSDSFASGADHRQQPHRATHAGSGGGGRSSSVGHF